MPRSGPHCARPGRWASLRRFRRNEKGATAVEFAIIAVPFLALLFATIEVALVYFAGQALETAVSSSARLIRTGQAQESKMGADDFKQQVCDQVRTLFDCANGLKVEVKTFKTFDSIDLSRPLTGNGSLKQNFDYKPGHGGDIVVVRAFYEWPVFVTGLGFDLTNMNNGSHLLMSAAAFRNEPFPW